MCWDAAASCSPPPSPPKGSWAFASAIVPWQSCGPYTPHHAAPPGGARACFKRPDFATATHNHPPPPPALPPLSSRPPPLADMKGAPKVSKSGENVRVYALLAVIIGCSLGYAFWPTNAVTTNTAADADLLAALLRENERLRATAPVAAAAAAPAVRAFGSADHLAVAECCVGGGATMRWWVRGRGDGGRWLGCSQRSLQWQWAPSARTPLPPVCTHSPCPPPRHALALFWHSSRALLCGQPKRPQRSVTEGHTHCWSHLQLPLTSCATPPPHALPCPPSFFPPFPQPVQTVSCNCEDAERARDNALADKRALEKENRDLRDEITQLRAQANARAAAPAVAASALVNSGDILPVASCAHQKLEFVRCVVVAASVSCVHMCDACTCVSVLRAGRPFFTCLAPPPPAGRWQNDANGVAKQCPFIPENYENWEKMPPLCDYISIECLGRGNKRAAHVFGFGGPGLMIGYADVLTWEFVFARHQNLKVRVYVWVCVHVYTLQVHVCVMGEVCVWVCACAWRCVLECTCLFAP